MDFQRQTKLFDPSKVGGIPIVVIGAGAVGGIATLFLAKVGFQNIKVYDHDKVEEHNIPNQFYPISSIGLPKVEALAKVVYDFTGTAIDTFERRWEPSEPLEGIVISSVDSMAVRQQIFSKLLECKEILYLIDPRMAGLDFRVACVNFLNHDKYSWYPDEEASPEMCGARSIMFNMGIIGGIVCDMACQIAKGEVPPSEISGDLQTLGFTTIEA